MGFRLTDVVKHLLIINIIVFLASKFVASGILYDWFPVYFPLNDNFKAWQIITSMFMHADESHLLHNMLMLFFIGPMVEHALGSKRFLFLYISAGIGAIILSFLVDFIQFQIALGTLLENGFIKEDIINLIKTRKYNLAWEMILGDNGLKHLVVNYNARLLGASGALTGVLAVLGLMFPNRELHLLFPPIRLKIKYLAFGIIGSDFVSALLTGTPLLGNSNVGYIAHVGGAITGIIIFLIWKKNSMDNYRWN